MWNVFEIAQEALHILRYGYPLGQEPSNRINHDLPLPQCVILGIMLHHRNSGIDKVPASDVALWFRIVGGFLGLTDVDYTAESFCDAVMRAHHDRNNGGGNGGGGLASAA